MNNIIEISELTNEKLLLLVGESINSERLHAINFHNEKERIEKLVKLGKKWFAENYTHIQKVVCNSFFIKAYLDSERIKNRVVIIGAIADIIAPQFPGKPILAIAALVVEEGIETICSK